MCEFGLLTIPAFGVLVGALVSSFLDWRLLVLALICVAGGCLRGGLFWVVVLEFVGCCYGCFATGFVVVGFAL